MVELAEGDRALDCGNRGDLSISKGRPQSRCLKASALFAMQEPGLIQSLSQGLLPELSAWVEVGGIASSLCLRAFLLQPISI